MASAVHDFVIIGSGFGGSVSALRLREKGYSVLVLERGKRFGDDDFARSTWHLSKYLWAPALRCFGILQISPFRHVVALHGAGVGGGSLGYANVLMAPDDASFATAGWRFPIDWRAALEPHYGTARRMLGVVENPRLWPADHALREIARELGTESSFHPTTVGAYFGAPGVEAPDPYFGGDGPARRGCIHCGGCMVGCRHGAKNTLVKNYLWLAERRGAEVRAETEVRDIRALAGPQPGGARYALDVRTSTAPAYAREHDTILARNVVVAAGALGTLRLLFRCRDVTRSLPRLSPRLGDMVRTNSEAILGSVARKGDVDYSQGIAITSIFNADAKTTIEPVRYPAGSSSMRLLSGPLLHGGSLASRLARSAADVVRRPRDFLRTHVLPGWAERTTIMLVMQHEDNRIRMRLGRSALTLWRKRLVSYADDVATIPTQLPIGHDVTRRFAERTGGIASGSINESVFDVPLTAHILGGAPFGREASEGVVDARFEVHGYPGLYVVDGSVIPGNPGVNPSLTIAAMAEQAMTGIAAVRVPAAAHSIGTGKPSSEYSVVSGES